MEEESLKVLLALGEVTNRMDLTIFSKKVDLEPSETITQVQQLAKEGFLQKIGNGYGITDRGKKAIKALIPVPEDMDFQFYYALDRPAGMVVDTLEDFYIVIRQIEVESLEFHLYRGDFENWLINAVKDPQLASDFAIPRSRNLKGEELRSKLLKLLDENYGIQGLLQS